MKSKWWRLEEEIGQTFTVDESSTIKIRIEFFSCHFFPVYLIVTSYNSNKFSFPVFVHSESCLSLHFDGTWYGMKWNILCKEVSVSDTVHCCFMWCNHLCIINILNNSFWFILENYIEVLSSVSVKKLYIFPGFL